jgi:DNA (cytosine-5)-methyltransferase 1
MMTSEATVVATNAADTCPLQPADIGNTTLHDLLCSHSKPHGGIPVGSVLVTTQDAQPFLRLLTKRLGKIKPVGADPLHGNKLAIHLPIDAAALFEYDQVSQEIQDFMKETNSRYYSGVRTQDPLFGREPNFQNANPSCQFTFAEIFAGIGGFRLGLEPLGGEAVLASEICKAAINTYKTNFGSGGVVGDISGMYAEHLPHFDILTGGFPCQPFSIRGEQKGLASGYG